MSKKSKKKETEIKTEKETEQKEQDQTIENSDEQESVDQKEEEQNQENNVTEEETASEEEKDDEISVEEKLEAELNETKDKYLRLSAEFDNYRKRTLKEKMELSKTAGEQILLSILPVVDDFERGMSSMTEAKDINAVKQGIELIYNKFKEFLKQNSVKEIDAMHVELDTDLHDAVTKIPAPEEKLKGKIVDVIQKGYKLNDKVIRHSKVVVGE